MDRIRASYHAYQCMKYFRGHGDCKIPASSIESCTEDSRLLLNYQACPDVYGSESTGNVERVTEHCDINESSVITED